MNLLRPRALTVVALALAGAMPARLAAEPAVRWVSEGGDAARQVVEVSGLDAEAMTYLHRADLSVGEWRWVLAVYAGQAEQAGNDLPAMLGSYEVRGNTLRFEPVYPLAPGVTYRAIFRPAKGTSRTCGDSVTAHFQLAANDRRSSTVVAQVFPSAAILPENLLKLYIHFSSPMSRGHIYEHIHLFDEHGQAVELPFLELDEELWDPTMTRLTLFIDPGRIKRGVMPLEDVGPALVAGQRFRFVIDAAWKDAAGLPLVRGFEKPFVVGPPDREPPDPARWKIDLPGAAGRGALVVRFPEALDHAITQRVLRVTGAGGVPLEGAVKISHEERNWSFTPAAPWPRGTLHLVVPTAIEDLAGNNIGKEFDVDLFETGETRLTNNSVKLPLELR